MSLNIVAKVVLEACYESLQLDACQNYATITTDIQKKYNTSTVDNKTASEKYLQLISLVKDPCRNRLRIWLQTCVTQCMSKLCNNEDWKDFREMFIINQLR